MNIDEHREQTLCQILDNTARRVLFKEDNLVLFLRKTRSAGISAGKH